MNLIVHFTMPEIGQGMIAVIALSLISAGLLSMAIVATFIGQMLKKQLARLRLTVAGHRTPSPASVDLSSV